MTPNPDATFKALRAFNDPALAPLAGLTGRIDLRALAWFPSDTLLDKLGRALAERRALNVKELFESFEFFERVRRRLRAPHVADLCCGHGLTGLLFATFEREVQTVTLLDHARPESYDVVLDAIASVAPWVPGKVRFLERRVQGCAAVLEPGTRVIAVHACGARTDRVLDVAIALGTDAAVMPCCYAHTADDAPRALRDALGPAVATDIHRTYRLEAAGYRVDWTAIPSVITDMHRVLIATRPAGPTMDIAR